MKKDIIELTGENNQTLSFNLEAELSYDGYDYQILTPINSNMGLNEGEALVFRIENGEYFLEENDDIIDEIDKIYNNME